MLHQEAVLAVAHNTPVSSNGHQAKAPSQNKEIWGFVIELCFFLLQGFSQLWILKYTPYFHMWTQMNSSYMFVQQSITVSFAGLPVLRTLYKPMYKHKSPNSRICELCVL